MMRELSRLIGASAFVGLAAIGIAACEDSPVGPSLSAVPVTNLGLKPSQGNPGLCCCHVTGLARNDNSVAVHVTIKFSAFNAPPGPNAPAEPLSTILYFIKDLQPGQTHQIRSARLHLPVQPDPGRDPEREDRSRGEGHHVPTVLGRASPRWGLARSVRPVRPFGDRRY